MPDGSDIAREAIKDWDDGRAELGTWLSHCQQVSLYLFPDRSDFTTERTAGAKRMQYVYDATPLFALEMGAAGLHSMLTSDALPWFVTVPDDEALWRADAVRQWFRAADAADYAIFNSPRRNFAPQSHEVYQDDLAFGTAVMAVLPSDTSDVLFSTRHLKECVLAENEEDRVDQLSRRFEWTAKKAVQKWGEAAGEKVTKAYADGKHRQKFWFHHRVKPRLERDKQRADGRHKAFESLYVSESDMTLIDEGGFDAFPYVCPRLAKIPGETMGRGRGMLMLPDIKMLNELMKIVVLGGQKRIDPPLMLPDDGFMVPIRTTPGARNYFRAGTRPSDRITPIDTHGDIQLGIEMIAALRGNIKEGFFNNLMLSPTDPADPASAGKGVTATFTARQSQENMRALSPMNSRLNAEWSSPLVEQVRRINWQRSVMLRFGPGSPYPPPPEILKGARWHSEFKSPIALSQRASEMTAIDQLMQRQVQLRQIDPETAMIVDAEAVIRLEARDLNAPPEVLKSAERLSAEARQRMQMLQQQHEAEVAQGGTAALKNLAGARQQMEAA